MSIGEWIVTMLQSGAGSLASYLAAHVLLCLVPAFLIAGAMTALIPKEAITRYLGRNASPWVSYPMAAVGGFVLAVCSCTILPLFAGIYRQGAGLGPAITFLFVGPAINILAVSYTGVAIGMDIAVARRAATTRPITRRRPPTGPLLRGRASSGHRSSFCCCCWRGSSSARWPWTCSPRAMPR